MCYLLYLVGTKYIPEQVFVLLQAMVSMSVSAVQLVPPWRAALQLRWRAT